MGMFDTVHMTCPHCNKNTSEQTKSGRCELEDYQLNQDPVTTIAISGYIICCEKCNKPFTCELINKPFAVPRKLTENELENLN